MWPKSTTAPAAAQGRLRGSGASARKAAKRAIYPWINSQLVTVAESGDLCRLVTTIETYAPQMNLVNLATALHRLARLAPTAPAAAWRPRAQETLQHLATHVKTALERSGAAVGLPQCQALANIAWSFARLEFVDMALLEKLSQLGQKHLSGFKPFEISTILWAFATLGTFDETAWLCSQALFKDAVRRITAGPEEFSFRCLVMISWAFATAGQRDTNLFLGIAPRLLALAHMGNGRELANAIWSFSQAGIREERFFSVLVRRATPRLSELNANDLLHMLRSIVDAGCELSKGFIKKVQTASERFIYETQQEVRLILSDPSFKARCDSGQKAEVHSLRTSSEDSTEASSCNEGLGEVVRRVPRRQHRTGLTGDGTPKGPHRNLPMDLPKVFYVKNTFIDIDDRSLANSQDSGAGAPALRLPPSLDIIPSTISPEKLEAYRINYQRFRIGAAVGARCESSNSMVEANNLLHGGRSLEATRARGQVVGSLEAESLPGDMDHEAAGDRGAKESDQKDGGGQEKDKGAIWTASSSWQSVNRLTVKNTFLHFDDDQDAGDEPSGFTLPKPLPPTLGIIPPDIVSPERLEAYRMDYQRFRAGSATGARGELVGGVA